MPRPLDRRSFLRHSCLFGGSLLTCSIPLDRSAHAAPVRIDAPVVDELTVREITDNTHDIFLTGARRLAWRCGARDFREAPQGKTLESEWGLALHLESRKAQETRRYLLDFGFTPDVYANNLDLLKIDVSQVDALIISHGHYDHVGGLMGFLEALPPANAQGIASVYRRRGRFLQSLHSQRGRQLHGFRHAVRPAQAAGAGRRAGAVGGADRHRRPRLHDRRRAAHQHRARACRTPGWNTASATGWAATPAPT